MQALLACLSSLGSIAPLGTAPDPAEDWLGPSKRATLVSFDIQTDHTGDKNGFVPGQRTGYIILKSDGFTISRASPFGSEYVKYEGGILKQIQMGELLEEWETKKSETPMEHRPALFKALDEAVCKGIGDVVREALLKRVGGTPPVSPIVRRKDGVQTKVEYGKTWGALKRFTLDYFHPIDKRIVCTFKVILPAQKL